MHAGAYLAGGTANRMSEEPPLVLTKTLIEEYEQAMSLKAESRGKAVRSVAVTTPFVLILAFLFYQEWPWVGILVLLVGILVVMFVGADTGHYGRAPWQHPLYDKDLTSLKGAEVIFSRWKLDETQPDELQVLARVDGQLVETAVDMDGTERTYGPDWDEILSRVISTLDSMFGEAKIGAGNDC